MTRGMIYENLDFEQRINVINRTSMPESCPLHWHKYIEILALPETSKSTCTSNVRVNQHLYELKPGDLLFIWPGELHEITANSFHELIGVQLTATLLNENKDFYPYLNLFRVFHHISRKEFPDMSSHMSSHLEHMTDVISSKDSFQGIKNLIYFYEMFMDFGNYLNSSVSNCCTPTISRADKALEKINMTCNYIIENCEQNLTLDNVASHVGFSSFYLSRLFKKATSYSFVEYLTLQRIRRAQRYLVDSSLSITEISFQSGFKSISTFNRVFHKRKGCSPSEYRKYYLE